MKRGYNVAMAASNAVDVILERKRIAENLVISDDVQQCKEEHEYCVREINKALENINFESAFPVQHLALRNEINSLLFWTEKIDCAIERILHSSAIEHICEVHIDSNFYFVALHWPGDVRTVGYSKKLLGVLSRVMHFKVEIIAKLICKITWFTVDGSSYILVTSPERWQLFWSRFIKWQLLEQHQKTQCLLLVYLPTAVSTIITTYVNYSILDMLGFLHAYLGYCSRTDVCVKNFVQSNRCF